MSAHTKKHFVITGASGFLGSHLIAFLEERGHRCTGITRRPEKLADAQSWDDPLPEDTNVVIHFAGVSVATLWTPSKRRTILSSRLETTQHIGELMLALPRPPEAFLCASAVGIYGHRPGETLTEQSAIDPAKRFRWEVCDAWERTAQSICPPTTRLVALRLGNVIDPAGGMLAKLDQIFRHRFLPGFGLGEPRADFAWVGLEDALRLIVFASENPKIDGPLNVTAPERLSYGEFYRWLCERHRKRCWLHLPRPLLKLGLGELAHAVTDSQHVCPQKALDAGFVFPDATGFG